MGKNFENTIGSAPHVYSITAPPEVKNNTLQKNIESLVETIRNGIINGRDIEDDASPAYYIPFFIVRKRSYFIYNSDNSRGTNQ